MPNQITPADRHDFWRCLGAVIGFLFIATIAVTMAASVLEGPIS